MSGRSSKPIILSSDSDTSSESSSTSTDSSCDFPPEEYKYTFTYAVFHFAQPLIVIMAERLRDEHGIERAHIIEGGPNDLRWVHLEVKMATTALHWCDPSNVKELENYYQVKEDMEV